MVLPARSDPAGQTQSRSQEEAELGGARCSLLLRRTEEGFPQPTRHRATSSRLSAITQPVMTRSPRTAAASLDLDLARQLDPAWH